MNVICLIFMKFFLLLGYPYVVALVMDFCPRGVAILVLQYILSLVVPFELLRSACHAGVSATVLLLYCCISDTSLLCVRVACFAVVGLWLKSCAIG